MVVGIYLMTFLISLSVTAMLLVTHRRLITSIITLSVIVTVTSLGRYLVSIAGSMEMVRLGFIFLQVGSCFFPLVLIQILMDMCDIPYPKIAMALLTVFAAFTFSLCFPSPWDYHFYKSITLDTSLGYTTAIRVFGDWHFFYPLLLIIYMIVLVVVLILALIHNRKAHIKTVVVTVLLSGLILLFYGIDQLLDNGVDYYVHGFFLTTVLLMWRMERANMYDLSTNISASIEALDKNGYIEFDNAFRCMAVNSVVRKLFPEIDEKWRLNRKIPQYDSYLYNEVILWMYNRKDGDTKTITVNERFYELIVRPIPYLRNKCVGYLLALVDRTNQIKYMNAMESYKEDLEREVEKKTEHIAAIRDSMVIGIASMVESRDDSTGDHIKRTYAVMQVFAEHLKKHKQELGCTDEFLDMVTRAAPMHDLGKIAIDDSVLKKQGQFDAADFDLMKVHPAEGAKIVRDLLSGVEDPEFVQIAENVAHYHHEKWDGTGYPAGLKGEAIPLEARIMALPDVFDALASRRRYKDALPYDVVFPMIQGTLGSHFDPRLGALFIQCRPELEKMYKKWYEEDMDNEHLQLKPSHGSKPVFPIMKLQ